MSYLKVTVYSVTICQSEVATISFVLLTPVILISSINESPYSLQSMHYCRYYAYPQKYYKRPNFIIGLILWLVGFLINLHSDSILRSLRSTSTSASVISNTPDTKEYKIPRGGFFTFCSCANFFGEILEWTGYAIASNSLPAWAFLAWVCANLIPRGCAHHDWYLSNFKDYPKERWAVIPLII